MHTFLKIDRPVDIPRPLESEFPIIPILYVTYVLRHASKNPSTQSTLADIESPLGPRQEALMRIYRETLLVCFNTAFARSRGWRQSLIGVETAYLRDLTHAFALCDRHMRRIVGKWYRCAFCAKDLCADCEVLDTHDSTHIFVVFKAPVDMQAFRCGFSLAKFASMVLTGGVQNRHFADLENPAGSPPVLRGNIYYPRHE